MNERLPTIGVVLCGGGSRRMGTDKALLGSPPWAIRVASALEAAGSAPVVLLGGDPALDRHGLERVVDDEPGRGPLAALTVVGRRWPDHRIVVAACDLPELSASEVTPLVDAAVAATEPRAVLYQVDGEPQWSLFVLHPAVLAEVEQLVRHGRRALRELGPWSLTLPAPPGPGVRDVDDPETASLRGLDLRPSGREDRRR
jgi:molybdopterin-guanine dinucleotide biosynthesis protein A